MSTETQAVLVDAVPLFALAAVYLAATVLLAPLLWRDRHDAAVGDWAVPLVFPAVGIAGLVLGLLVVLDPEPLAGHEWWSFAAILVALVPGAVVLVRRGRGILAVGGIHTMREAEARVTARDRELGAVASISNALARTHDALTLGRVVADEVARLVEVEFVALALVDESGNHATGLVARRDEADLDWWRELRVDLRNEPSGIASAVFEATPVQVYDVAASPRVSRRLAEAVGAKSGAWIPMVAGERVVGVLVLATTESYRALSTDELDVLQAIASEAGIALERTRSADALREALDRERLVAEISRKVRSELDVQGLMAVAVEETAGALGASRCFIRLDGPDESISLGGEWRDQRLESVAGEVARLPVANLAAEQLRTVAVGDGECSEELDEDGRAVLASLGSRAALAVPIVVFERLIGVVAVHRREPGDWTQAEVSLAEAVAREVGLAVHTARLLGENRRRLEQQAALLHAGQVLTSELDLETVLARLVEETAALLRVDGADCYLLDPRRNVLRCAAAHGLPDDVLGFEFPARAGLAGEAIRQGRPVLSDDYADLEERMPSSLYDGFASALVAPISWSGETRGVLGVGVRDPDRRLDADEADLLGTIAGLAALALRNAESYEERSRQARIQRGFYRIAEVLGQPLSLAQTVEATAQAAAQALGGDHAAVLMPGPVGLELAGLHELPEPLVRAFAEGLPGYAQALAAAAEERRVLASSRIEDDDRFDPELQELAEASGCRSLLAIPIEAPREAAAALALVLFRDEHVFADDDLDLARQVASAASGAFERAELYETERSSRALAQQLARTGSLLATELDPAAVLAEVAEQAPALLDVDACSIRSLEGDELVVAAATGDGSETTVGARTPSTAWPAGDVVQSRAPVALTAIDSRSHTTAGEPLLAAGYSAYLGVPLYGREGSLHGVLAVYASEPRGWREEEVEALSALAANASVALSNAELYQRVALEREQSVAILANIADGIVAVDRDGRIVLWNAAAAGITGVPRVEAIGRTPAQVLHRELESDGTTPSGARLVSISRGGDELWLSLSEAVMRDPVGAVAGRIFAFRDISSERVVEQMKSDFVSTVSHELRTPLTSIYGFAETLLRQDVDFGEAERRTFLSYIASESERLTSIVDALLNVARLDTGDLQVQVTPTDVGQVVAEAVSSAEAANEGNGHRFVLDLEEALNAEADAEKLRQIVDQLIQNAIKFSPDGGTVTVAGRRRIDAVQVSVVDEGIGIAPAEQQRIFTKFHRADAGSRAPGGAGLGLFIAQGLVSAMGGRIWVDSAEGRGSSFTFELPVQRQGE